jgi:tetratricopeptide (TPR) repeat protein
MFRRVHFECGACGEGFVDWHDEEWERTPVFCVNCGEPIAAGAPVDSELSLERGSPRTEGQAASALGVLKSSGNGFRDTLPGLRVAGSDTSSSDAPEASGDAEQRTLSATPGPFAKANSAAPRANVGPGSPWTARRRKLAPLGALLVGFALGVPLTLVAEEPISRLMHPSAYASAELTRKLAAVSTAIDDGSLQQARSLLDRCVGSAPATDRRLTTLRARLALALILTNRPAEAGQELAAMQNLPRVHPAANELQRLYDIVFVAKPSGAAVNAPPANTPPSTAKALPAVNAPPAAKAPPAPTKPAVSKQELLDFARDRQRRSQLDDAQRLYEAILRFHPEDAEARCGLAEVQLLRGSVADATALFERALQSNARFVPAWIGLGDIDWLRGRPERAACRYQAVVDRFPNGSYPPYIAQRIARVTGSGVSPPAARSDVTARDACGN